MKEKKFIEFLNDTTQFEYLDYKLAYKIYGKNKKTILLFYGFCGSIEQMNYFAPYFTNDYQVLIIDYPGHGYSDRKFIFEIEKYIKFVKNLLDNLDINEIYLLGYSLGGPVSIRFYQLYPFLVKKLCLLNTLPNFSYNFIKKNQYLFYEILLKLNFTLILTDITIPILADKYFDKEMIAIAKKVVLKNDIKSMINFYNKLIAYNTEDMLEKIGCPVKYICSSLDFLAPPKICKKKSIKIKNCEFEEIKDYGHLSFLSSEDLIANKIIKFFNATSP